MNNGIGTIIPPHLPMLRAATSEEGTEIVSVNQNAAVLCKNDHLLGGGCGIELTPQLWVTIHPIQEVIQSIQ